MGFDLATSALARRMRRAGNHKGIRIMRKSLWGGLLLSLAFLAHAESSGDLSKYLRGDHPDTYTVVRGDTLWDISGRFLTKPWVWPELWHANPQIENPNLIYPGDTIHLDYVEGRPRLSVERGNGDGGNGSGGRYGPGSGRVQPRVRESPLASAIPAIRLDKIEGFLVAHRVVDPAQFAAAPYVLAGDSRRIIIGAGDRFYSKGKIEPNASYGIFRKGAVYVDPDTKEFLGLEATSIGTAQGIENTADIGTLIVSRSDEEVRRGDRLLTTEERRLESTFFPSAPKATVTGKIIAVSGGVSQVGQWAVVVLNRGTLQGLEVGHVLAVYQLGELARDITSGNSVQLPSERAGLLMIFRTFERLSYGLVLRTERPLAVGDEVRNP